MAIDGSGGFLGDLLGGVGSYFQGQDALGNMREEGQTAYNMANQLGQEAVANSAFKPFTVTSNIANTTTTPEGGVNIGLSGQQQGLQNTAFDNASMMGQNIGGNYNPATGQIGNTALYQSGNYIGGLGQQDQGINAQRWAMGNMFGQEAGQYGQPTGFEGLSQAGIQSAQQQIGGAQQPQDLNALRGQFAGLAGQGVNDLGQSTAGREADIYNSLRATQLPEEERQRLALEERLFSQGRRGVSTDAYGGTPEQLAMAKAQAEAGNTASLMARQQAQAEQNQAFQRATSAAGTAGQLAGQAAGLESQGISNAGQLANIGIAGQQAGQGTEQQRIANLLQLQQADQRAAGTQQSLSKGQFDIGAGLFGLGNQSQALQGQLTGQDIGNLQNMMQAGYAPNQQALAELGGATNIANIAGTGSRTGAQLAAQAGAQGIQGYLQALQMENDAKAIQNQDYMNLLTGANNAGSSGLLGALTGGSTGGGLTGEGSLLDSLGYNDVEGDTPQWIKDLGGIFGF
tara:strand:- start:1201 stop:2742 length:1542 start_codon:yes stop_codon:yes gene_type:complete